MVRLSRESYKKLTGRIAASGSASPKSGVNKYGNQPKICLKGHRHPSSGEADYCNLLHLKVQSLGKKYASVEYEKAYKLECNGVKICVHKPDWTLEMVGDLPPEIWEFKGKETLEWRLKLKMFRACYPELRYFVVKKIKGQFQVKEIK